MDHELRRSVDGRHDVCGHPSRHEFPNATFDCKRIQADSFDIKVNKIVKMCWARD